MRQPLEFRRTTIEREAALLATTIAGIDPARPVPTCPGWRAGDLLRHVVEVHDFWAHVIGDRLDAAGVEAYQRDRAPLPDDIAELLEARASATTSLIAALTGRDPSDAAWSWFPPEQTVGFTWRMQTHEITMHRVDAELAAGLDVSPIDPEVAGEGIDHAIDVMWAWARGADQRDTGVVELVATDDVRRRLVRTYLATGEVWGQALTDRPAAERAADDAQPVATVTGTSEQLDLFCWGRPADVTAEGDPTALDTLRGATSTPY